MSKTKETVIETPIEEGEPKIEDVEKEQTPPLEEEDSETTSDGEGEFECANPKCPKKEKKHIGCKNPNCPVHGKGKGGGVGELLFRLMTSEDRENRPKKEKEIMFKIKIAERAKVPVFKFVTITREDALLEKLKDVKGKVYNNVIKTQDGWYVVDEVFQKWMFEKNDYKIIGDFEVE